MAEVHVNSLSELLGKSVVLTERLGELEIERRGVVTAFVQVAPGSRQCEEFLLEQDDGDVVFYSLENVSLHCVI